MELIDKYIHEVTRRLPEKNRGAIALELKASIEDMLPLEFTEDDVKEALKKLGDPAVLANSYQEKPMYLIGPLYYQIYVSLLKIIVPIAMTIALIVFVVDFAFSYTGDEALLKVVLSIVGEGISEMIEVAIQAFFWLTLVFAVLERVAKEPDKDLVSSNNRKWTPDALKKVRLTTSHNSISKYAFFGTLVWTAIWVSIYFNADRLLGVYVNEADNLVFKFSTFNQQILNDFWVLIVVIAVLGIALALYKLQQGQWTKKVVIFQSFYELISTAAFIIIITRPNIIEPEFTKYLLTYVDMQEERSVFLIVLVAVVISIITAVFSIKDAISRSKM
ncbi:hypothetical protein JFL43_09810 [Viridibacillus sp. YIM B01967]|uniref:ABC transporter permease n=1 Tax=Viridibacillus soli TaxID=2798301 RepID=A0ABS1H6X2_9BACL|nr:hypothetical protein [Viridibacillus soli]MBK3495145.1 hypothetical protein [Viridibacillus soli]